MSAPNYEPIIGRYLNLDCEGRAYRLYVEENGQGIPLLCLHTAGSDGRQYRGLLNDAAVTQNFRVIAFDLPWHGKSSPPAGWQNEEYQLTIASYTAIIRAVSRALALDRPVVMGCSIGGRIVLHLAVEHAKEFRAIIGLQSSAYVEPYYDTSWLHRPDVHGGEVAAGYVSGLMAPMSPEAERWESIWHYMQSGPGVFKGDLHFYKFAGDVRDHIAKIDTSVAPVYLLTGEYDYSASPKAAQEAADRIKGSKLTIMEKLGHFPMSENPALFLRYLRPVLDEIKERA